MRTHTPNIQTIAEDAAEWLLRLEDDGSQQCREEFVAWLKHSPAHMDEFLLVTSAYRAMHGADPGRKIDAAELFRRSGRPVVSLQRELKTAGAQQSPRRFVLSGLAAALVFVALAGWWAFPLFIGVHTYSTAVGEQRTVKLAEGSVVYLNTQSLIRTRFSRSLREIQLLDGEALFVVEKDPARPFRVLAGPTVVQAIGTQFNVYRRSDAVKVSVIEGSVQVSAGANPAPLQAGEEAKVTAAGAIVKHATEDSTQAIAWRQRQLVFHSRPLREIAAEFNRYNRMQLRVEGQTMPNRRVTGVFSADNPQALLKFLETDADLQVRRLDDTVFIRARED
jgi:transmembrane sensor